MAGVLKVKCQHQIFRLRFDVENFTFEKLQDMFKQVKSSEGREPHYRDDEGDLCVLNELTFEDFVANAGSKTLQVELQSPLEEEQHQRQSSTARAPSKGSTKKKAKKIRGRSPSSSSSSSSSSDSSDSDSSSSSGSSDSDSSSDSDVDEHEVPQSTAEAFLQSLADEYVLHRKCAVGKFLKKKLVPKRMLGKVDSTEKKVSRSKNPRAAIAELARKWEVACPDCCTEGPRSCKKDSNNTSSSKASTEGSPKGISKEELELHRIKFVKALVAEYLRGEDGDVGKFFHKWRPSSPWAEQFLNYEDAVRKSENPADSIQSLAIYWQIPVPTDCQEGVEPPFNVYTTFLEAIEKQYSGGEEGAVGEFFERCRDVKAYRTVAKLEQQEDKFREQLEQGVSYEMAMEQLKTDLGLPFVVELNNEEPVEPEQAPSSCAAASSPKSEVSASCAAAAIPTTEKKSFDFECPVAIAPGEFLDLRWNIGDDPMTVALSFASEHGIPFEEADKIASYVDHITASSGRQ
mmetsp:Transcript_21594/g.46981  ORF Transcript_21594/g.46981 Transcript_21594/m.46981 type:complete len:516 (-) Transcript_21594:60-1607(-)|eukprot:CAMPEP_0206444682 /NCGR_PEP_ID=MMETSP0324_2-20121206/15054_1 /ASSEMBLY_ACC=CAM_ASM_000836 /TAXON_ID=2866 /ORGANISM="Crypthecodinium cohnii, Strain Seligo" /LENGTH=515 /DNA_ID=CAMNT_0053912745 /DNA_START=109 /DNA_END=1656 /DNA_ORIENTATION=+